MEMFHVRRMRLGQNQNTFVLVFFHIFSEVGDEAPFTGNGKKELTVKKCLSCQPCPPGLDKFRIEVQTRS